MAYSKSFKNELPYYRWYDNLCGTRKHIKERCDEIERKYIEKQQTNNADREKEYMKNEELGMIFDQHSDISSKDFNYQKRSWILFSNQLNNYQSFLTRFVP